MCWEITASANMTVLLLFVSVFNMRSAEIVELRGEIYIQRYFGLSPFLLHKFSVWFSRDKISDLKYIVISVQRWIPVSLQSNKNSYVGEKQWWVHTIWHFKPTNFLVFATPCDWVQHPPLWRNVYRVLRVMTESVSVFSSFFGLRLLESKWKAPLWAGLTSGWANRLSWGWRRFRKWRLFLELMSFSSATRLITAYLLQLLFAKRLILLDAADCCEIQRRFCQFLEKNLTLQFVFSSSQLVWNRVDLVKSTEWLLGGVTILGFLVLVCAA